MTIAASPLQRRIAALLILAVLALAFWVGPVSAYLDLVQGNAAQAEQKSALLARYRALDHGLAENAAPGTATAAHPATDLLLPEIPDSQALAMLQERVKALADAAQVQIQGLQVLKTEPLAGAMRIGVRVRAAGDVGGLGRLLHAVEAARPLLLPDNLQVQSRVLPAAATTKGAGGATAPTSLDFQLDIAAFKAGGSS